MIMPVHHSQLLRYAWPSPASLPDFSVDFNRPFFLMTKLEHQHRNQGDHPAVTNVCVTCPLTHLVPINKPLPTARHTPTILNVTLFWSSPRPSACEGDADADADIVALALADEDMARGRSGDQRKQRWGERPALPNFARLLGSCLKRPVASWRLAIEGVK